MGLAVLLQIIRSALVLPRNVFSMLRHLHRCYFNDRRTHRCEMVLDTVETGIRVHPSVISS